MTQTELALKTAEIKMKAAIPNPAFWSGSAAIACAAAIERLATELHQLQVRLANYHW